MVGIWFKLRKKTTTILRLALGLGSYCCPPHGLLQTHVATKPWTDTHVCMNAVLVEPHKNHFQDHPKLLYRFKL